ncbi:hypothetical protein CEXT_557191 [Caerostris extrusa]|uniref:Uncharacterized protein n=1 Tax=Caerostris extrusa TaxID=172846 RepID=A0AAV4SZP5_CAEEX|nr:hypothetical protein CEXT_557191 [Caerostris extrusa]
MLPLMRVDTFPVLWEEDKPGRNQHLTCGIEETSPSMYVIGRDSKEAKMKRIASLALIRTRYRDERKRNRGDERDRFLPKQFRYRVRYG